MSNIRIDNKKLILGFVGSGAITKAVIIGLMEKAGFKGRILISERNRDISTDLYYRFDGVSVSGDNQEIISNSDLVFFAVLPTQLEDLASRLEFRADQTIISLVAATSLAVLAEWFAPCATIHRLIPMPPIEKGVGPISLYPPSKDIENFLDALGEVIAVEDESHFDLMSAASSVMASYFEWSATVARWMGTKGFEEEQGAKYISSLFAALSEMLTETDAAQLKGLSEEVLTKGGLNEQLLNHIRGSGFFETLKIGLDDIEKRIQNY